MARYKISLVNNSPSIVIECETVKEMQDSIKDILPTYDRFVERMRPSQAASVVVQRQEPVVVPEDTPICQVHNVPMVWKAGVSTKTGKSYAFWACSLKNPDGSYCKYKPAPKVDPQTVNPQDIPF